MTYDQLNKMSEALTETSRALRIADHFVFDDDSLTDFGIAKAIAHLKEADEALESLWQEHRAKKKRAT